jgi:hypothetical protein
VSDEFDDRAIAQLLADESVWVEPPADLEARVLAAIEGEPVLDLAAARRRRARTVAPWLVAAAAAAAALVLGLRPLGGSPADFTAALAGTGRIAGAHGTARLLDTPSGFEIRLDLQGLPRAPRGFYYQAWVKGPRGLVTIGTFHTGGKVVLWAGVDPRSYSTLTVTLEPEDGDAASSGDKVLAGPIVAR